MLNKTKHFRKICLSGCFVVGLVCLSNPANAQFIGINADYAIAYSAAPGSVTGGSVGIAHPAPFFPNIGYSAVSFNDKVDITDSSESSSSVSLSTKTTIKTINLFYNVPFPVVSIAVGFGFGSDNLYTGVETETTIVETYIGAKRTEEISEFKTDVTEAFMRIGLPFWSTIEFHLGYHAMSFTSINITKSATLLGTYSIDRKRYSGGMTTIGVQVAF